MSQRELIDGRVRPRVADLTPAQIAGEACLWCAAALGATAVPLRAQRLRFGLEPIHWYPHRCPHRCPDC